MLMQRLRIQPANSLGAQKTREQAALEGMLKTCATPAAAVVVAVAVLGGVAVVAPAAAAQAVDVGAAGAAAAAATSFAS